MPLSQLSPRLPYNFPPIHLRDTSFHAKFDQILTSTSQVVAGEEVERICILPGSSLQPPPLPGCSPTRLVMCRSGNIPCFASHPPQQLPFKKPWRRLISVLGQVLCFITEQELDLCFNRFFSCYCCFACACSAYSRFVRFSFVFSLRASKFSFWQWQCKRMYI